MLELVFAVGERLQQRAGTVLPYVAQAASLAALKAMPPVWPAAYVLPLAHDAQGNAALQGVAQLQSLTFAVLLAVKHAGDASGAAAAEQLVQCRDEVHRALVGWTPEGCGTCVAFAGGSLERMEAGAVWWTDEFLVARMWAAPDQT